MISQSDGSGSKFFDPGRFRSIFCGLGRVGSAIYGSGLNLENFPKKCLIFQFFSLWVKKNRFGKVPGSKAGWPLIYCGSKVSSSQGPFLPPTSKCGDVAWTVNRDCVSGCSKKPIDDLPNREKIQY